MTTDVVASSRRPFDWGAEVALMLVTAAVAVALVRAFRTWDPLWPLLLVVVAAHGSSIVGRHFRWPALPATLAALAIGAVVIGLVYYARYSWFGLPTNDTLRHALDDSHHAFGPFQKLVAPVDATGFDVTFAVGIWLMATFADLAAWRSEAPVQAVVAHVVVFVFSSVLLLGRYAPLATVVFVGSIAVYRLAYRAGDVRRGADASTVATGLERRPRAGTGVVWGAGAPMLAIILLAGSAVAAIARAPAGGMIDLRAIGRGGPSRIVESPLVSLDALLGAESDRLLFTVTSPNPHYWRLTALDDFNGRSWSATARDRDLASGEAIRSPFDRGAPKTHETMRVDVKGLQSDWLPVAYSPSSIDSPIGVRVDAPSGSVFVADGESTVDLTYHADSDIAEPRLDTLRGATRLSTRGMSDYLKLPASISPSVRAMAVQVVSGRGPFDSAIVLENFFQRDGRFTYDRNADYRDAADPLLEFLRERRGFCQQFATAFAAMARSVGLPSRVAVGFTYGEPQGPLGPNGKPQTWAVRGRYAHVWPEVYFAGTGWVAFEPTPGRGNPDASAYDTRNVAQSDGGDGSVPIEQTITSTTTTTTIAAGAAGVPTTAPDFQRNRAGDGTSSASSGNPSNAPLYVLAALIALGIVITAAGRLRIMLVRRRRQHGRAPTVPSPQRVATSWREACRSLGRVDVRSRPAETPLEFASRAADLVEVEELVRLGRRESDRRFREALPTDAEATEAERISDDVREVVWSRLDRRQKLLAELDLGGRDQR